MNVYPSDGTLTTSDSESRMTQARHDRPPMRQHIIAHILCLLGAIVAIACNASPDSVVPSAEHPSAFAGRWVRVYPHVSGLDTLILHRDGSVSGSLTQLNSTDYRLLRWKIGDRVMPGGFCIGEGDQPDGQRRYSCVGYRMIGDTLALADIRHTVLIRALADPRVVIRPWDRPRLPVAAPAVGESVPANQVSRRP